MPSGTLLVRLPCKQFKEAQRESRSLGIDKHLVGCYVSDTTAFPTPLSANRTPLVPPLPYVWVLQTPSAFMPHNDELGKLVRESVTALQASPDWKSFVIQQRVEPLDLAASIGDINHPARHLLLHLRTNGAPVPLTTRPWNQARKDQVVVQGPHQSANLDREFVRKEFTDFVWKKFWIVLPYRLVRHLENL